MEGLQLQGTAEPSTDEEPSARLHSSAAASTSGQPHDRAMTPEVIDSTQLQDITTNMLGAGSSRKKESPFWA